MYGITEENASSPQKRMSLGKKRTSSEVKDIPGRIPLSDIASVLGSNNDLNETQKLASTTD